jgi:replicative DNA helicase
MNLAVPIVMPAPIQNQAGPHCIEAEQALIGTLLSYEAARNDVLPILKPDHFHEPLLARMYVWIKECAQMGARCDAITAIARFKNDPTLIELGGNAYIARLAAIADVPMMAKCYADTIIQYWKRRVLMEIGEDVAMGAAEPGMSVEQLYALAIEELSRPDDTTETPLLQPGKITAGIVESVTTGEIPPRGAYCGTDRLDTLLGGWRPGALYVMAGKPGMGKSTLAPALLLRSARQGHRVLYISLEMTAEELVQRALTDLAYTRDGTLGYADLRTGALTDWQRERIQQVAPILDELPITYVDKAGLTVSDIRMLIQREERERGKPEVVCIDHGLLLKADGAYSGNKVAESEGVISGLKQLAKELKVAVIALWQLNRGTDHREEKRPNMGDLKWSSGVEENADVLGFLHREVYYLERDRSGTMEERGLRRDRALSCKHDLELDIAKHRGGPTDVLDFWADMASGHVRDGEKKQR